MGCDYYHEMLLKDREDTDESELSDEPGELEFIIKVYDENKAVVERKEVSVEVPVGGKVYLDRITDEQIWAR